MLSFMKALGLKRLKYNDKTFTAEHRPLPMLSTQIGPQHPKNFRDPHYLLLQWTEDLVRVAEILWIGRYTLWWPTTDATHSTALRLSNTGMNINLKNPYLPMDLFMLEFQPHGLNIQYTYRHGFYTF